MVLVVGGADAGVVSGVLQRVEDHDVVVLDESASPEASRWGSPAKRLEARSSAAA